MSQGDTCLLPWWCPAQRWRELGSGSSVELGNASPRYGRPRVSGRREGEPQTAETVRGRVPMRGRRADRPVVATKPGNAGRAKGTGCPGSFGDQLIWSGGVG